MANQPQFNNDRFDHNDHKKTKGAALGTKILAGIAAVGTPVAIYIKKNGVQATKETVKLVAKSIFRIKG